MATSRRLDEIGGLPIPVLVLVLAPVIVLVMKEDLVGIVVFVPVGRTAACCVSNDGPAKEEALFQVVAREIKVSSITLLLEGRSSRTVVVCASRVVMVTVVVLNSNQLIN